MFAIFIIVLLLCFGVCQWASGRYAVVTHEGFKERAPTPHTAAEMVMLFLAYEGVSDVQVIEHRGPASDYFDPRRRRLFLRPEVARSTSLGAWAIALHEAGHALQTGEALPELKWRQTVITMNRYGPMFGVLGLVGLIFVKIPPRFAIAALLGLCIIFLLLNLGTLAVEYNANARVRRFLEKHLARHSDAHDRLNAYLARVAMKEVGDLLSSPRYFLLSGLPGSGKIRPSTTREESADYKPE